MQCSHCTTLRNAVTLLRHDLHVNWQFLFCLHMLSNWKTRVFIQYCYLSANFSVSDSLGRFSSRVKLAFRISLFSIPAAAESVFVMHDTWMGWLWFLFIMVFWGVTMSVLWAVSVMDQQVFVQIVSIPHINRLAVQFLTIKTATVLFVVLLFSVSFSFLLSWLRSILFLLYFLSFFLY